MVVQSSQIEPRRYSGPWSLFWQTYQDSIFNLRNIAKIWHVLSKNEAEKCIHAFVSSRIDYCNALHSGYPDKALNKLQLVLNTAARILTRTKCLYHITPVLASLHWLPVKARADFKVLQLTYKALHGLAPTYLYVLILPYIPTHMLQSQDTGPWVLKKKNQIKFYLSLTHG